MLPKFGQARAKLECKMRIVAQARSAFEHRIPQPPAPRGLERIGPENFSPASSRFNAQSLRRPAALPAFFIGSVFGKTNSGRLIFGRPIGETYLVKRI
jgi:hypothetical protein